VEGQNITRYEQIYEAVRRIPPGKVATYGQIAKIVGRCTARMVGYAMAALPWGVEVPWQRVINHKGEISARSRGDGVLRQRRLLQKEGIRFDRKGRVNLKKVRWAGPESSASRPEGRDLSEEEGLGWKRVRRRK
jgi:methylated-DNA-protein-cysteine methyltransferase-like protein